LWVSLGLFTEGAHRLETAVAHIEPHTSESDHARLWLWLGRILDETPARARPLLERAAELYRRLGDPLGLGLSLARLGRVLALMGRFEQAEAALSEAQPLLERTGLPKAPVYYFFTSRTLSHSAEIHSLPASMQARLSGNRGGCGFGLVGS